MENRAPIDQADLERQNPSISNNSFEQAIVDFARTLADCKPRRTDFYIPARLKQLMDFFQECYEYFDESTKTTVTVSQTAEWIMDNFYVVEQAIRQIEEDLPHDYYDRLPKTQEVWARIYTLA